LPSGLGDVGLEHVVVLGQRQGFVDQGDGVFVANHDSEMPSGDRAVKAARSRSMLFLAPPPSAPRSFVGSDEERPRAALPSAAESMCTDADRRQLSLPVAILIVADHDADPANAGNSNTAR
jgi:hypothetical protein